MKISEIQPITGEPALFIKDKKILVVADLHIGIESQLIQQGFNIKSRAEKTVNHLINLIKKYKPQSIVLLGDVKHNIPRSTFHERKDVTFFLEEIQKHARVDIMPGNHDGNIKQLCPKDIEVQSSDGFLIDEVGFIHGHRWPKKELVQKSKIIIIGHTHPTIQLTDRIGHKNFEPCWLKGNLLKNKIFERYKIKSISKILIMPAFNPLCGGIPVNKEGIMGPFQKIIDLNALEVFLIDGSYLGFIKDVLTK